jgi:hypothetical protein
VDSTVWCAAIDVNASFGAHQRWIDELPLAPWPAMGVRSDERPWPRADAPAALLASRRRVLADDPACVGALDGSETACAEVAALAGVPGATLAEAAVAQPDDLCVLAPDPGWPLVAGAVLFPSHWRLADKLGRPLAAVHGPVPSFAGELAGRVGRFLERLRPGTAAWRRNVLLHPDGELHAPDPRPDAAAVPPEAWWLRSERQTFRRLPGTGAVLFTIGVDTVPLVALDAPTRRRLAAWLRELPAGWEPYTGVPVAVLADHLDQ